MSDENPPMEPGDLGTLAEPPKWPKVVGIISIVWAGLGLTCTGCGLASMVFMPQLMKVSEQAMGGPMPAIMQPGPLQIVLTAASLIPVILLLLAGIATVGRKPTGRPLHLAYAVVSIVMSVASTVVAAQHQLAVIEWAQQNPDSKWAGQAQSPMAWIGLAFGILIGLAWPVFCLIWFGLVKRRNADITEGLEEPAA